MYAYTDRIKTIIDNIDSDAMILLSLTLSLAVLGNGDRLADGRRSGNNIYVIAFTAARALSSWDSSQLYFTPQFFSHPVFPKLLESISVWHLMCVDGQSSWSWLAEKGVSGH